jgi:hypothetical protein
MWKGVPVFTAFLLWRLGIERWRPVGFLALQFSQEIGGSNLSACPPSGRDRCQSAHNSHGVFDVSTLH